MGKARYIFWDSDNTLTDNGELHWRKHRETLAKQGVILDERHKPRVYQNNGAQNWEWFRDELGLQLDCPAYLRLIDRWYQDHVGEISFRPGVPEALDLFAAAGCHQCVVSNGRRNSVMISLEAKAVVSRFDFILCKEDYAGRKPDPVPYLTARARMEAVVGSSVDPETCLAIEDDPLGVTSAHAAGLPVIHRRLKDTAPPAPEARCSVFSKEDFLEEIRRYV